MNIIIFYAYYNTHKLNKNFQRYDCIRLFPLDNKLELVEFIF
jgi:hypothetical protein